MEFEQETNQDAEIVPPGESEILEDLEDLKNDEIQTLEIMPFAVPIHNWNDLKDSVSWAETLIGMSSALKNHMVKYNRLIDTVAQLTRDWNRDISDLQVSLTGTTSIAKDANTKIESFRPRITSLETYRTDQRAWNATINSWRNTTDSEITGLWSSNNARKNEIKNNSDSVNSLWASNALRIAEITTLFASNEIRKSETDRNLAGINMLWDSNSARQKDINLLWDSNTARVSEIARNFKSINELWVSNDARVSEIARNFSEINSLWISNAAREKEISDLAKQNTLRKSETDKNMKEIASLWSSNNARIDDISALDKRVKKIESYNLGDIFDLTVLVTAINAVGTKIQKLVDLFNVDKVLPGTFTFFLQANIKTQTDAITQALSMVDESLNDNFINYFDDDKNGKFWQAFKKFSDFQMAVFFGVFFETLREDWDKNWLDILETWNITNDLLLLSNQWLDLINNQLSSANNTLAIITQWLKQIYEKPLGNINNEEGTNIWDFLSAIVDNLGDIITTQLKEFVKALREILDFLNGLIDKLIALLIPEDTNFITNGFNGIKVKFNVKFGALLGLADSLKDLFTPTPRDFKQAVSFDFLGAKFEPDFSMIDPYVKKFRVVMSLSLWMSVVVFIFRKITGTGDLVNDN